MESFDIVFSYNNIRFSNKDTYKATVVKDEDDGSSVYQVLVHSKKLQSLYSNLYLVKKDTGWVWSYAGDVDLFNLNIQIAEAIEMYESHAEEYAAG